MTTSILARISRRNFPSYPVQRTADMWRSRGELVEYEEALRVRAEVEALVEGTGWVEKGRTGGKERERGKEKDKEEQAECLRRAWEVCEGVLERWQTVVERESAMAANQEEERPYYLRRFEAGWVYTQTLEHGARALGRLRRHAREADLLRELLGQRVYRFGKRGAWYDRLALVLGVHIADRAAKKEALEVCARALADQEVHSSELGKRIERLHMSALQRRIIRLENELGIPKREQHDFSYLVGLKKAEARHASVSPTLSPVRSPFGETTMVRSVPSKGSRWDTTNRWGIGDSIVRTGLSRRWYLHYKCCLQDCARHEKQHVKSTHSYIMTSSASSSGISSSNLTRAPSRPLTRLLLSISRPTHFTSVRLSSLDAGSFVSRLDPTARCYEINRRLRDISNGEFADLLRVADERERDRNTWCIGVSWEYEREDLKEIAEVTLFSGRFQSEERFLCIGGPALSQICRAFAEEYGHRCGGLPDLWYALNSALPS
ncbi:hypothetical protein BC938DRAFT_472935, partial [Jimgerdemannia flammicorona]